MIEVEHLSLDVWESVKRVVVQASNYPRERAYPRGPLRVMVSQGEWNKTHLTRKAAQEPRGFILKSGTTHICFNPVGRDTR